MDSLRVGRSRFWAWLIAVAPSPPGGLTEPTVSLSPGVLVNAPYPANVSNRRYVLRLHSSPPPVTIHLHPVGAEIIRKGPPKPGAPRRGSISDMSLKSRLRAAYQFGNAPRAWGVMVTLTFPAQPEQPKDALVRWRRAMRDILRPDVQWGWIMEFQTRGVIHYHVFIERSSLLSDGLLWPHCIRRVMRHGRATDLVGGRLEYLCVTRWLACLPVITAEAEAFNWGGIVELMRTPEAAGRYIAKEAGKRHQKKLPEGVEAAGRWWWLNPRFNPPTLRTLQAPDVGLPPFRRVFDQESIALPRSIYELATLPTPSTQPTLA